MGEVMQLVTNGLVTLVVAVFGGKSIYDWFFLKQDKDGKEADNEAKVVETLKTALDMLQGQLEKSNQDSNEKQEVIIALQKDLYNERKEHAETERKLAIAEFLKCEVKLCGKRQPPTGY